MTEEKFNLDAKLTQWHEAEQQLNFWKQRENELRKEIFEAMFPDPKKGMNKTKIDHGMALIGDYRLNYKVDKAVLDVLLQDKEVEPIVRQVITFDPRCSGSKFEDLSDNEKKALGSLITVTPGTPGLEIKPANKVRW